MVANLARGEGLHGAKGPRWGESLDIFQNKVKMGGALLGMEKGGCQGPFFFTVPQAALYPCTALESLLALKDLSRLSMALL